MTSFTGGRTARITTMVAAVALLGSGCGLVGSPSEDAAAAAVVDEEFMETVKTWDDGLERFVVTAPPSANGGSGDGYSVGVGSASLVRAALARQNDPSIERVEIIGPDGSVTRTRISLPVTWAQPRTPAEERFEAALPSGVHLARTADGRLIGKGVDGTFHDPGIVVDDITPADPPEATPTDAPPAEAPTPEAPTPDSAAADPAVDPTAEPTVLGDTEPVDTVVTGPVPGEDAAFIAALVETGLFAEILPLGGGMAGVATSADEATVRALGAVGEVAVDVPLEFGSSDPHLARQWALDNTGAGAQAAGVPGVVDADMDVPAAWSVARGDDVVVAVIDSGIDLTHPDFAGQLWTNDDEICGNGVDDDGNGFVDDCNGWDFGLNDNDPSSDAEDPVRNHGNHVAGIIAAGADNGVGIAGVAPGAKIMPIKVSRRGGIAMSWAAAAVDYAVANGADVINMSLSTAPYQPRSAAEPFENAFATAAANDVVIVVGSGNIGAVIGENDTSSWPAGFAGIYDNVIAAGATTNSDRRASWSNHGPGITVYAPGSHIYSTLHGGSYGFMSGTSMAAPNVAGAAAVLLSSGQVSSAGELRARLTATVDEVEGLGRVNLAAAVGASEASSGALSMRVDGLDTLTPDAPGPFTAALAAPMEGDGSIRFSVATVEAGQVLAVTGLAARIGGSDRMTDDAGAFAPVPVEGARLSGDGHVVEFESTFPAGQYALIAELLDGSGGAISPPMAVFFAVAEPGAPSSPAATQPPAATDDPPATGGSDAGSAGGGATASDGGAGSPSPTAPEAPSGSGGDPTAPTNRPSTGTPAATGSSPTTPRTPDAGGSVTTDAPGAATNGSSPTAPSSPSGPSSPSTPATPTRPPTPTDRQPTTSGGTGAGTGDGGSADETIPLPPAPEPVESGEWALTALSPRTGPVTGGTTIALSGRFPTGVDINVWFGERNVQTRTFSPSQLLVTVPSSLQPGTVDVSVRFNRSGPLMLLLEDGYTYQPDGGAVTPSGPGAASGTSSGSTSSSSSSTSSDTTSPPRRSGSDGSGAGSTDGNTPSPTPPPSTPTDPGTPPPSGGGGSGATPGTSTPPRVSVNRGTVVLRPAPAGSPIAGLSSQRWSTPCSASCSAVSL
ncbi:MAG: S8 family serine peptidase [Acidimicrobiales bacterium]